MFAALSMPATIDDNSRVDTAHSFTGRMCAASRWIEGQRKDALFVTISLPDVSEEKLALTSNTLTFT